MALSKSVECENYTWNSKIADVVSVGVFERNGPAEKYRSRALGEKLFLI